MKFINWLATSSGIVVVFGLVAAAAGVLLTLAAAAKPSPDQLILAIGSILLALGGFAASWGVSESHATARARAAANQSLTGIGHELATLSTSLRDAVVDGDEGRESAETAFYAIAQSVGRLSAIVYRLEQATGQALDFQEMAHRIQEVADLRLASVTGSQADNQPAVDAKDLAAYINYFNRAAGVSPLSEKPKVETEVACPECGTLTRSRIGLSHGESGTAFCQGCNRRFHIHRAIDLTIFARSFGATRGPTLETVKQCAGCSERIVFRYAKADVEPVDRYCVSCGCRLTLDPQTAEVVEEKLNSSIEANLVEGSGDKYLLACPSCQLQYSTFLRRSDDVFAVCSKDRLLLRGVVAGVGTPTISLPALPETT